MKLAPWKVANKKVVVVGIALVLTALAFTTYWLGTSSNGSNLTGYVENKSKDTLSLESKNSNGAITLDSTKPAGSIVITNDTVSPNSIRFYGSLDPKSIEIKELVRSTNTERKKKGVASLSLNKKLSESAKTKCSDMVQRNYWSHESPGGTTVGGIISSTGLEYVKAGENLAAGFENAQAVISGWMDSPGHRRNLLDSDFTDVGFAVCKSLSFVGYANNPSLIVVQHFARL